jgi:hypothetical protein
MYGFQTSVFVLRETPPWGNWMIPFSEPACGRERAITTFIGIHEEEFYEVISHM